jgi:hypothetical protein
MDPAFKVKSLSIRVRKEIWIPMEVAESSTINQLLEQI